MPIDWPSGYGTHTVPLVGDLTLHVPDNIRAKLKNPFMPWDKSLKDRWGKIIFLSELECGAPWELYVETAAPAFLVMLKSVLEPGKIDVIKARLNHSYNCGFKNLFREAEKHLPNGAPQATKFLFRLAGPVFAVLWYYFLADAFTDFVLNWETAIIARQPCGPRPIGGPCQLSNAFNSIVISDTYFPINWFTIDNDPSGWTGTGTPESVISPGKIAAYKVYSGAAFTNHEFTAQTVTYRITDGLGNEIAGPESVTVQPGQTAHALVYGTSIATSVAQALYGCSYKTSPGGNQGIVASGGSFTVSAQ